MSSQKVTLSSNDYFQDPKYQQTIPKDIQGKIDLEISNDSGSDQKYDDETGKKNYQGALQFHPRVQFTQEEEEFMINRWKDERLKKLEDFTKDLLTSASKTSAKKGDQATQQYQYQGFKRNEFEIDLGQDQKKIDFQIQQKVLSPVILKSPQQLEYNSSQTHGSCQKSKKQVDIEVDEDLESSDADDQDDELLLTKSDGTLKLQNQVLSTQRSIHQQSGEFEKRITDIKAKLNQIKNTINSEIETSFQGMTNSNQKQPENYNYFDRNSYRDETRANKLDFQQKMESQRNTQRQGSHKKEELKEYFRDQRQFSNQRAETQKLDSYREDRPRSLEGSKKKMQHNSVLSSLDNFQNKLNAIKGNMNQQNQQYQFRIQEQIEKEKFQRIKAIVDNGYISTTSPSKYNSNKKSQGQMEETNKYSSNNTNLEHTLSYSNQKKSEYETLRENDSLKQKLAVMMANEQRLQNQLAELMEQQVNDKRHYELQLNNMQNEMGKMFELIQDLTKQKSSRGKSNQRSHNCNKKKRIVELEEVVKDLQFQLNSKTTSTTQPTLVTAQANDTINIDIPQQQQQEREINLPRKNSKGSKNKENKELRDQVTFLEKKLLSLKNDIKESKSSQNLNEQLQYEREENQYLRNTYNKTYNEMMESFQHFREEMEKKQNTIEEETKQRTDKLEQRFKEELTRKGDEIERLEVENQQLRERMGKIREAFDLPKQQLDVVITERNKENQVVKSGKKKSNSKAKVFKKKGLKQEKTGMPLQVRAISQKKKLNF